MKRTSSQLKQLARESLAHRFSLPVMACVITFGIIMLVNMLPAALFPETELAKVQEVFGNVQPVVVADVDGEFGFVTEVMTEAEYKAKAESFGEVLGMIRVRRVED